MLESLVFYSSLAYNVVLYRLNIRAWYDRIDKVVLLGALPFRGKSSQLVMTRWAPPLVVNLLLNNNNLVTTRKQLRDQENVRAVISMNHDFELKPFSPTIEEYKKLGIEFLQLATRDFVEAPSMDNLRLGVELIEKYVKQPDSTVYIHCKAGRTRSATLAACYLIKVCLPLFWLLFISRLDCLLCCCC